MQKSIGTVHSFQRLFIALINSIQDLYVNEVNMYNEYVYSGVYISCFFYVNNRKGLKK